MTTAARERPSGSKDVAAPLEASPTTITRSNPDRRDRVFVRLPSDDKQRLEYWADKHQMSANEYVTQAVQESIRRENQDYDLPTLEIARINQLVDVVQANTTNLANLERVVTQGFDTLIGLTRGDNYLLEDESGEL